ncbi:MAG: RdgB/HAM1 family non-canonical purine NTP pyrophosphatase [Planctomycetes bacterium]|nr:RdgB/HAM1 family non-canonical purine NTP pyrophosphatase [Planctomycetota bacterium]
MQLLFATSNPHKIQEVAAILKPLDIDVVGLDRLDVQLPEPIEDGKTFEENAKIKAVYYAKAIGRMCLADDSGLEVDALGGKPGVYSARYANIDGSRSERDQANNIKLLDELKGVPQEDRAARFVCAMCLVDCQGSVVAQTQGTFEGVIVDQPRGNNGFGYDPLLYLPDVGSTSAQLSSEQKNARSHRGDAARQIAQCVSELGIQL